MYHAHLYLKSSESGTEHPIAIVFLQAFSILDLKHLVATGAS